MIAYRKNLKRLVRVNNSRHLLEYFFQGLKSNISLYYKWLNLFVRDLTTSASSDLDAVFRSNILLLRRLEWRRRVEPAFHGLYVFASTRRRLYSLVVSSFWFCICWYLLVPICGSRLHSNYTAVGMRSQRAGAFYCLN